MHRKTTFVWSFLGVLLIILGMFVLPWYVLSIRTIASLLQGPRGWLIIVTPFQNGGLNLIGWFSVVLLLITTLLALLDLIVGILAWTQNHHHWASRMYKISSRLGLACLSAIFILLIVGFVRASGWSVLSLLRGFSGLGLWLSAIGFLVILRSGISLERR